MTNELLFVAGMSRENSTGRKSVFALDADYFVVSVDECQWWDYNLLPKARQCL